MKGKNLKSPDLNNTSHYLSNYRKNPKFFYFPSNSSQIWLNPLMHDHQPTYFTNLKIKILMRRFLITLYSSYCTIGNISTKDLILNMHSKCWSKISKTIPCKTNLYVNMIPNVFMFCYILHKLIYDIRINRLS
jgi:hypothetical protein